MKFITIYITNLPPDLYILKSKLESEDVRCYIKDDYILNIDPLLQINEILINEEDSKESKHIADKIMRHITGAVELQIAKILFFRAGYHYQRRQELKIETRRGLAGYSFGLGIQAKKFHLDYGFVKYHLAANAHLFSLQIPLKKNR